MKMNEKRFSETERNCYYTTLVFDNQTQEKLETDKVVVLLNKQDMKINDLQEENEELRHEMEIEKKWQLEKDRYYVDLHKKYDKLEKENEQLRKELDSFHPVMFQDMRYGTVTLYSKGGIDE